MAYISKPFNEGGWCVAGAVLRRFSWLCNYLNLSRAHGLMKRCERFRVRICRRVWNAFVEGRRGFFSSEYLPLKAVSKLYEGNIYFLNIKKIFLRCIDLN